MSHHAVIWIHNNCLEIVDVAKNISPIEIRAKRRKRFGEIRDGIMESSHNRTFRPKRADEAADPFKNMTHAAVKIDPANGTKHGKILRVGDGKHSKSGIGGYRRNACFHVTNLDPRSTPLPCDPEHPRG